MVRAALMIALVLSTPAWAQTRPGSEAAGQTSTMGPASGHRDGGSNGVGTQGSLTHDDGKASSTVAGVHGGTSSYGGSTGGHAKPAENQPSVGGGS